ncbi:MULTISPECIES: DUF2752 domain-containing protein [Enterococcus]|uniref:DUF2752 domain-containing protein n=1 Tax=Enterococcus TaxID=1350 RepID=UPI0014858C4F|nr:MULTISPECIES: DUF2752 domain-containing protein [Enterococcus]KAF1300172.1 hypothetical protein BAU16_13070 [Enterococcus sp. JM9B]
MCFFKAITGLPCPGCGMTRAFLHFFSGDFTGAFYYHPLFWLVALIFGALLGKKYFPRLAVILRKEKLWLSLLGVVLVVYGIRLFLLFPEYPPMDFDQQALLPRLLRQIF